MPVQGDHIRGGHLQLGWARRHVLLHGGGAPAALFSIHTLAVRGVRGWCTRPTWQSHARKRVASSRLETCRPILVCSCCGRSPNARRQPRGPQVWLCIIHKRCMRCTPPWLGVRAPAGACAQLSGTMRCMGSMGFIGLHAGVRVSSSCT